MTTLVVGASGVTGKLLITQLLNAGEEIRIIVRSSSNLSLEANSRLTITYANLLELTDEELTEQVKGCNVIASCLGHNMTFEGLFGHPRKLVTDATQRLCEAAIKSSPQTPIKFVLMNTTGNQNKNAGEQISLAQACVIGVLRKILPPHVDNEQAAGFLQSQIGECNKNLEWVVVRPDSLIDDDNVTPYCLHASPTRSAIFNAGQTSRINVANFMTRLITDNSLWQLWKGQMPVMYNVA